MKIIDRPYNLIFNHVSKRYEATLVILFAVILVNDEIYPIAFDFWIAKNMLSEDELYSSKVDIAMNLVDNLLERGLKISSSLFDAGFCQVKFLEYLNSKGIAYTCRFHKNREVKFQGEKLSAKGIFMEEYNGNFYYYDKYGFVNHRKVNYAKNLSELVVVAANKDKLNNRDFFCLLSTEGLSYTEILRLYRKRFKIEQFFKNLKSYIGLTSFNTHNQDKISIHITFCLSGYVMVQELAKRLNLTFYKALQWVQTHSESIVERKLKPIWNKFSQMFDNNTFQTLMVA